MDGGGDTPCCLLAQKKLLGEAKTHPDGKKSDIETHLLHLLHNQLQIQSHTRAFQRLCMCVQV